MIDIRIHAEHMHAWGKNEGNKLLKKFFTRNNLLKNVRLVQKAREKGI